MKNFLEHLFSTVLHCQRIGYFKHRDYFFLCFFFSALCGNVFEREAESDSLLCKLVFFFYTFQVQIKWSWLDTVIITSLCLKLFSLTLLFWFSPQKHLVSCLGPVRDVFTRNHPALHTEDCLQKRWIEGVWCSECLMCVLCSDCYCYSQGQYVSFI